MVITRQMLAEKISAYLQGRQSLDELVAWAEDSMQEAEFDEQDFPAIRDVVARLGVADVAAFGLAWQDAVDMLGRLGYQATVGIHAVR
jgi:secreted Zn-dependent insulinase-like peptidase